MSKFWATHSDSDSDDGDSSSSCDSNEVDDLGSVPWSSSSSSSDSTDTDVDVSKVDDDDDDNNKNNNNPSKQDKGEGPLSPSLSSLLEGDARCDIDGDDNVSDISSNELQLDAAADDNDPNLDWERIQDHQVFMEPPKWERTYDSSTTGKNHERSFTRLVCISDTHAQHRNLPFLPKGDVLIHGGDFTKCGELGTVQDLNQYFGEIKTHHQFQQVIGIAGNHDTTFHPEYYDTSERCRNMSFDCEKAKKLLTHCTYLEDSTCFVGPSTSPLEVYGSPWTPNFYDWAFMKPRGQPLSDIWSQIPSTTDVLITHGPPLGRNDETDHSGYTGCWDLLQEVQNRIKPRVHIFGHIHQGYGTSYDGTTLYVNASSLSSESHHGMNPPIVVDVPHDPTQSAYLVQPDCPVKNPYTLFTWLQYNQYDELVQHIQEEEILSTDDDHWMSSSSLPLGNDLLKESAYAELCDIWLLHRNPSARRELRYALCQLHAESFQ